MAILSKLIYGKAGEQSSYEPRFGIRPKSKSQLSCSPSPARLVIFLSLSPHL